MNTRIVVISALGVIVVSGFIAWRRSMPERPAANNYVLFDISLSDGHPCRSLGSVLRRRLVTDKAEGSWTLFATGSAVTAFEPVPIPINDAPVDTRLMEGAEEADNANLRFVNDAVHACEAISSSLSTPLYLGIRRISAQARARGGTASIHVVSDLEETTEKSIARALAEAPKSKLNLPEPIDNYGVTLHICGYAETIGDYQHKEKNGKYRTATFTPARTAERSQRLIEVWRGLFTDPDAVEFAPFCS